MINSPRCALFVLCSMTTLIPLHAFEPPEADSILVERYKAEMRNQFMIDYAAIAKKPDGVSNLTKRFNRFSPEVRDFYPVMKVRAQIARALKGHIDPSKEHVLDVAIIEFEKIFYRNFP